MTKYPIIIVFFLFLYSLKITAQFTEVSQPTGVDIFCDSPILFGGGVAVFDYNNDGFEDFYITGGQNADMLYENNGNGTFSPKNIEVGIVVTDNWITTGVVTGDIDNDGVREIFVYTMLPKNQASGLTATNLLFKLNENNIYENIAETAGLTEAAFTMGASFGDYNLDGYLDLFVINYIDEFMVQTDSMDNPIFQHICYDNYFYLNNGDGTFTEQSAELGLSNTGCALATTFTDLNNDTNPDIYLANDFGEYILPNYAYINNYPEEGFTDSSAELGLDIGLFGMGIAIGDYDNDLDLDYYVTNLGRNVLLENNGNNIFTDVATETGVENTYSDTLLATSWGCNFADFDADGFVDLYVSNGFIPADDYIKTNEKASNKFYLNNQNGGFTDLSVEMGVNDSIINRGSALIDYDNDGDLDIINVTADAFEMTNNPHSFVYRNDFDNNNNWLKVKLEGVECNKDAYGSKIIIHASEFSNIREIGGGSSHASQNTSIAHFGLGEKTVIDSLIVYWTGGQKEIWYNIENNQTLHLIQGETVTNSISSIPKNLEVYPTIISDTDVLNITANGIKNVKIYNLVTGYLVYQQDFKHSNKINLAASELKFINKGSGFYLVAVQTEQHTLPLIEKIFVK